MASLVDWLHDKGYQFSGETPIAGLTPMELNLLKLGHVVNQEQQRDEVGDARRGTGHSKARASTRQLAKEKVRGFD